MFAEDKATSETPSVPLAQGVKSRGSSGISYGSQTQPGHSPPPGVRAAGVDGPILPVTLPKTLP